MTITTISQIYGTKVEKVAFLEWCVAHPTSEWTKGLMTMEESMRLNEYIQYLKDGCLPRDDSFDDYDWEIFGYLSVNEGVDAIDKYGVRETFGLYVPTHDQQEADRKNIVIVGVRVTQIYSITNTLVTCDTQLPFRPTVQTLMRADEMLDNQDFTKGISERRLYLVQNFCSCCT